MTSDNDAVPILIDLVQKSSLLKIKQLSGRSDISLSEVPTAPLVFAHWMSFILLSTKSMKMLFKVHYQTEMAKFFAAKAFSSSEEELSKSRALDFFKEFCNLTAGNIKAGLASNNVKAGISLPILARGFDEIFYIRTTNSVIRSWSLSCHKKKVFCSANIEMLETMKLKNIESNGDNVGDVEFL